MWLKISEDRLCPSCEVPIEHWVLYGQSGRVVGETTFCPICYPDVRGFLRKPRPVLGENALETSRAIHLPDAP